jgi:hypothetical protein
MTMSYLYRLTSLSPITWCDVEATAHKLQHDHIHAIWPYPSKDEPKAIEYLTAIRNRPIEDHTSPEAWGVSVDAMREYNKRVKWLRRIVGPQRDLEAMQVPRTPWTQAEVRAMSFRFRPGVYDLDDGHYFVVESTYENAYSGPHANTKWKRYTFCVTLRDAEHNDLATFDESARRHIDGRMRDTVREFEDHVRLGWVLRGAEGREPQPQQVAA